MIIRKQVFIVGAHAGGEIGNVLVGGVLNVPGSSAFEKMEYLRESQDSLRRCILFEPRGSACHAVNVLLPSSHPEADAAFVIMEPTKYPLMSGSNAMCVATVLLETGIREIREPVTRLVLEAPGGLVEAVCSCAGGKVTRVTLRMLPSFVVSQATRIDVPGYGRLDIAIAYGGIFYAIVPAAAVGKGLDAHHATDLVQAGILIRAAANRALTVAHPENPTIRGVQNVILAGELGTSPEGSFETVSATVIGNGRLDRSPCGTGVSARMALLHEQGLVGPGQRVMHRSIFGTSFESQIIERGHVGNVPAVVPAVSGQAWITGFHQIVVDPSDPLAEGHCPKDVWLTQG